MHKLPKQSLRENYLQVFSCLVIVAMLTVSSAGCATESIQPSNPGVPAGTAIRSNAQPTETERDQQADEDECSCSIRKRHQVERRLKRKREQSIKDIDAPPQ